MSEKELVSYIRDNSPVLEPKPAGLPARLIHVPHIRLCLFDIYGTLFISGSGDVGTARKAGSHDAFQFALSRALKEYVPAECAAYAARRYFELIDQSHERSKARGVEYPEIDVRDIWRALLADLAQVCRSEAVVRAAVAIDNEQIALLSLYYETAVNPAYPMPGLQQVLATLSASPIALGIVSNAQFFTPLLFRAHLGQSVEQLGFNDRYISYSYREGSAKPGTAIFSGVIERAREDGIAPEHIVYLGNDMRNDIRTASTLGLKTILFAGDERSLRLRKGTVHDTRPDAVITELQQLTAMLEGEHS